MNYLTPTLKILPFDTGAPIALSFGGSTESANSNYIQPLEFANNAGSDETW